MERVDALVVGGGFFGLFVAEHLRKNHVESVLVVEREDDLMKRASFVNQARIHNGYHYPRSLTTALSSHKNYPRFCEDFRDCVYEEFQQYYAIARRYSKVNGEQFERFCNLVGAPIQPAGGEVRALFNFNHVEQVFAVEECAFDATILKQIMIERVRFADVEVRLGTELERIREGEDDAIEAEIRDSNREYSVHAQSVYICIYSQINKVLHHSNLPLIPLKHEWTEIVLLELPAPLREIGITIMCGPFFSTMPFPPRQLHTLSHVRYTPHAEWFDDDSTYVDAGDASSSLPRRSAFSYMIRDAARYVPSLRDAEYRGSLWETKTLLPGSEINDSRPILVRWDCGIKNCHAILGAKIDNVYDIAAVLTSRYGEQG